MGRQRVSKPANDEAEAYAVLCDGQLIGAGMALTDATIFVMESRTANPEKTFKLIPHPKGGKKEVTP
jgi:hypothetical protein